MTEHYISPDMQAIRNQVATQLASVQESVDTPDAIATDTSNTNSKRGRGSVYFNKSRNKWMAMLSLGGKRFGKRFDTQDEAERWLRNNQPVKEILLRPVNDASLDQYALEITTTMNVPAASIDDAIRLTRHLYGQALLDILSVRKVNT